MSKPQHIIFWIGLFFSLILPSFLKAGTEPLFKAEPQFVIKSNYNVICTDSSAVLIAEAAYPGVRVRWDNRNNGPVTPERIVTPQNTTTYTCWFFDADWNFLDSVHKTIYVTEKPTAIRVNDTLCPEDTRDFTLGMITSARYFDWFTVGVTKDSMNDWIVPPKDSAFPVRISNYPILQDGYSNNCYRLDTAFLIVDTAHFNIIGDTEGCEGSTITLRVVDGDSIRWSTGDTTNTITPKLSASGVYSVTAQDYRGCRATKTFTVRSKPTPTNVAITAHNKLVCRGASTVLAATGNNIARYEWYNKETANSIEIWPRDPFFYSVTVYSTLDPAEECYVKDSVLIDVRNCDVVYFPTAIRLSGSAENRIFKPIGIPNDFSRYYLAIFNRFGQLIFESDDLVKDSKFESGWDGMHQGKNVRPGVYGYLFRLTNRRDVWEKKGTVTVID
jgi:hypothetical protein